MCTRARKANFLIRMNLEKLAGGKLFRTPYLVLPHQPCTAHFQAQIRTFKPCLGAFKVTLWQSVSFLHENAVSGAAGIGIHARHDAGIPTPPSTPQTVMCGLRIAGGTRWMTHVGVTCTPPPQSRSKTVKLLLQLPVETPFAHASCPELRQPSHLGWGLRSCV